MGEENKPNEKEEQKSQEMENHNVESIVNNQTDNIEVASGESTQKKGKGKHVILIVAILLIVAIIAGLVYYFTIYNKPDKMYQRLVGSTIDSYTNERKEMDYKTSKTAYKLSAQLDTNQLDKDILDLINKINLGVEVQVDNEEKEFLMNLKADYETDNLLDIQMYSDVDKEKTYMKIKNLLNKYLKVEEIDDEFYSLLKEALENPKMTNNEKISLQKAMNIIKKEFTNTIKKEYCSAQKEEINIKGKTVNTTKNVIKMNIKQLKEESITVFKNLKKNEEFINCFEDDEEVYETLDDLIDKLEELEDDEATTVEIAIYTEGIMEKVAKFDVTIDNEKRDQTLKITVTKTEENSYYFELLEDNDTVCTGIIKVEEKNEKEGTIKLDMDVSDFGKIKLNIDYSQKFNEDMDQIDVTDSIDPDELTREDQQTLATNLQKSKLYELIQSFLEKNNSDLMQLP